MSQFEGGGGSIPAPGPNATLRDLKTAYKSVESSDMPLFVKERVLFDLAERIRDFGKEKKPAPMGEGRLFKGATIEEVAATDFDGRLPVDGHMTKAKQ